MDVESYNSAKQDAKMLLGLTAYDRSAVYGTHITLWFAPHVVVRISDVEIPKLAREFQELGTTPDWFVRVVEKVLRKRHKLAKDNTTSMVNVNDLLKVAQLYLTDPTLDKLVTKIVAEFTARELIGT